jgi:hypothetical protein
MAELQTENLGMSDAELFNGAVASEPPAEVKTEQVADTGTADGPKEDATGRLHGADGKFAPKTAEAKEPEPTAPDTPKDKPDAMVPSWRLGEVSEERRRWQAEAEQHKRDLEDTRRRMAALEQQQRQATQKPVEVPDLLADPNAFTSHIQETVEQRIRNIEANFSFRLAHTMNKDVFEKAYSEMVSRAERGDRSAVQAVMGSPDPGQALISWYKRDQTIAKVGDDPDAWFEKRKAELLDDEAFLAQAMEKARAKANGDQANGSRPNVKLPPSLSRLPSAGSHAEQGGDMSDASLFNYAMAPRR